MIMVFNSDDLFPQVPARGSDINHTNDTFEILNQDEMRDFSYAGESFYFVLKDEDRRVVKESVRTSLVLPVDTKASLKNLLSESFKVDDSCVRNNPVNHDSSTIDASGKVFNLSDKRVEIPSNRTFNTEEVHKVVDVQSLMNSTFAKTNIYSKPVERETRYTSLVEKAGSDVLKSEPGSLNKTFDVESSLEAVDKTHIASKLQFLIKSKKDLFSVQLSLRNNNELSSSNPCHSTPMKGSEIVVSCGGPSYYAEKHNRVFSETSPIVSTSAAGNLLSRSLDDCGDVSISDSNNINDETFDWKVDSLDKTYEKYNVCNGTYVGGRNSYRNLQSETDMSQELKMVNDKDNFFLQVPAGEISTNDSFGILNDNEMKDFTLYGESFWSVVEYDHQVVDESLSTSMILPVDTKASLESLLTESVKVDDSYVKNNGEYNGKNFTRESHEKVSVLSDERVIAFKRACDTMGVLKSVDMQGLLNSRFGKDDSSCNHVEIESGNASVVEKAGIDVLRSKSCYMNETFVAEGFVEDEDSIDIASKLQFSPKTETNFSSVQMSLRNNNELSSSSSCHSTPMKDIEEVVSCSDSTYVEKSNKAITDQCHVVSPSSVSGDKLSSSNVSILDDVVVDVSCNGDVIKDETFDGKVKPIDKTFDKFEFYDRADVGCPKSLSSLPSRTYMSQGNKNSTFEKSRDSDGLPHHDEVGMIVTEFPVSPPKVIFSQENLNEAKEVYVSMPMECDDSRVDSKDLDVNGSKLLLSNSRHRTKNHYSSNTEDKLLTNRAKLDKNESLIATNVSKPKLDSNLHQHNFKKSAVPGSRNNQMGKPVERFTGSVRSYSKLNKNSKVLLTGVSMHKTAVRLVQGRKDSHQTRSRPEGNTRSFCESKLRKHLSQSGKQRSIPTALGKEASQDTRSIGESKVRKQLGQLGKQTSTSTALGGEASQDTRCVDESRYRKQASPSEMRSSVPTALGKENSQIRSNIPVLFRKSGIPMPSSVSASSLKVKSQIPTKPGR